MKDAITVSAPVYAGAVQQTTKDVACTATGHGTSLADWLTPGSMLVYVRMLRLPNHARVDGRCYGYWQILDPACAAATEELIVNAGWQFFRMEPMIDVNAMGVARSSTLANALRKATRAAENESLNALEIVSVEQRKLLGLHTARIVAFARHIQRAAQYEYCGDNPAFRPIRGSLHVTGRKLQ